MRLRRRLGSSVNQTDTDRARSGDRSCIESPHDCRAIVVPLMLGSVGIPSRSVLQGRASMLERLINFSLTQRFLVCFAGIVLMCSGFCAFRHVVCYSTKQLGAAWTCR